MDIRLVAALIGLCGVIVGSFLTNQFNHSREHRRDLRAALIRTLKDCYDYRSSLLDHYWFLLPGDVNMSPMERRGPLSDRLSRLLVVEALLRTDLNELRFLHEASTKATIRAIEKMINFEYPQHGDNMLSFNEMHNQMGTFIANIEADVESLRRSTSNCTCND